jgi:hypothetical protein
MYRIILALKYASSCSIAPLQNLRRKVMRTSNKILKLLPVFKKTSGAARAARHGVEEQQQV